MATFQGSRSYRGESDEHDKIERRLVGALREIIREDGGDPHGLEVGELSYDHGDVKFVLYTREEDE